MCINLINYGLPCFFTIQFSVSFPLAKSFLGKLETTRWEASFQSIVRGNFAMERTKLTVKKERKKERKFVLSIVYGVKKGNCKLACVELQILDLSFREDLKV